MAPTVGIILDIPETLFILLFLVTFYLFTFLLVLFCPGFDSGFESTEILLPSQTKTKRKGLGDVWIKGGGARVFVYVCVCVRAHTYFASKPNRK
jgi:hypothetical protein